MRVTRCARTRGPLKARGPEGVERQRVGDAGGGVAAFEPRVIGSIGTDARGLGDKRAGRRGCAVGELRRNGFVGTCDAGHYLLR